MGAYLNNAATSYPKPDVVRQAVAVALAAPPTEPGRTGGAGDPTLTARRALAALFGVRDPCRVILLSSCSHALNLVVAGALGRGGHAVTSVLEHNSVLRPLAHAERERGATVTRLVPAPDGRLDPAAVRAALRPDTRLIVLAQASNVTGALQPVDDLAAVAAAARVPFLVDAAQSAGTVPLDHAALAGRVFVAFAGHKGLQGPAGTGGLIVPDGELPPWMVGGTGVHSESELQPAELPLRYEAGTPNLCGLAGLAAGVAWVRERGVDAHGRHRAALVHALRDALRALPGTWLAQLPAEDGRAGIVTFNRQGWASEELAFVLRESFGLETRPGLHCAPLAHRFLGTAPAGAVRVGFGPFNAREDVDRLVDALRQAGCP